MKNFRAVYLIPFLFILGFGQNQELQNGTFKVLVFSKTMGYRHESIIAGLAAFRKLGAENNFIVETTEDARLFTNEFLSGFKLVVFLNTTGDVLNEDQQNAFEKYIQTGGGYLGIHAASDTEYDWPWYGRLAGAYFNGHPNNPNVRKATICVKEAEHISYRKLPTEWIRHDEWYNFKDMNPEITVLCALDEKSYEGGNQGDNHPISWYHEYEGGRAFYTGMGHTSETFEEPLFLSHLLGGILWASGQSETR